MQRDSLKFAWDTDKLQWDTDHLKFGYQNVEEYPQSQPNYYNPQQYQQPQIIYVPQQAPQPVYIPPQEHAPERIPVYPTRNDPTAIKVIKTVCIIGVIFLMIYAIFIYDPSIGENLINSFKNIINTFINFPHV